MEIELKDKTKILSFIITINNNFEVSIGKTYIDIKVSQLISTNIIKYSEFAKRNKYVLTFKDTNLLRFEKEIKEITNEILKV